MKQFLTETNITWPCGYGAVDTLTRTRGGIHPAGLGRRHGRQDPLELRLRRLARTPRSKTAPLARLPFRLPIAATEQKRPAMTTVSGENITSVLQESRVFPPPPEFAAQANIKSEDEYNRMWNRAKDDPAGFWGEMAANLSWFRKWDKVLDGAMPNTQVVCRRQNQRVLQLPRPAPVDVAQEQGGHHLGRRAGRLPRAALSGPASRGVPLRQCARRNWGSRRATASRSTCR